jgi:hypothetical protein
VTNPDPVPVETATFVDRSRWPSGPWDDEPDRVDWRDPTTGYPCFVKRGPLGAWCGYVGLPPGHSLHGSDFDDLTVYVHGGLSYAAECEPDDPDDDRPHAERICHVPAPGEPDDVWWFGFDCSHGGDVIPMLPSTLDLASAGVPTTYRTVDYARSSTAGLARQLAALAEATSRVDG